MPHRLTSVTVTLGHRNSIRPVNNLVNESQRLAFGRHSSTQTNSRTPGWLNDNRI